MPACKLGPALLALTAALAAGCGHRQPPPSETALPEGYLRRLTVVLEQADFSPLAGIGLTIETVPPTALASPAGGRGRTDGQGRLELVFAPQPRQNLAARAGGDVIVDYPVQAVLTLPGGRTWFLEDQETFARYQDARYQGLNRDPETRPTYYIITLP